MADVWRQFKVLFWKNCLIQKRNPKGNISNKPEVNPITRSTVRKTGSTEIWKWSKVTLAEFLIPAFLSSLLLIGRGQGNVIVFRDCTIPYPSINGWRKLGDHDVILVEPILFENVTTWDHFVLDSMDNEYVLKPWSSQNNRLCIQGICFNSSRCCSITCEIEKSVENIEKNHRTRTNRQIGLKMEIFCLPIHQWTILQLILWVTSKARWSNRC